MEALIQVNTNEQGSSVVSARELYNFLEVSTKFNDWIKRMFSYGFTENQDYILVTQKRATNNPKNPFTTENDFALTLDTAKEISMLQRNDKGKIARQYFIECEKKLQQSLPSNTIDFLQLALNKMRENENRLTVLEEKVNSNVLINNQLQTDEFTIVGFATLNKIKCNIQLACQLGKICKAEARKNNIELQTLPDPRFGIVNLYPKTILEKIFKEQRLIF